MTKQEYDEGQLSTKGVQNQWTTYQFTKMLQLWIISQLSRIATLDQ